MRCIGLRRGYRYIRDGELFLLRRYYVLITDKYVKVFYRRKFIFRDTLITQERSCFLYIFTLISLLFIGGWRNDNQVVAKNEGVFQTDFRRVFEVLEKRYCLLPPK